MRALDATIPLQNKFASLFTSKRKTCTQCHHCKNFFESSETPFTSFPLPLISGDTCSIDSSLHAVLGGEFLEGSNQYYCTVCEGLQNACLYTSIIQFPMVFVIFLQSTYIPQNFTITEKLQLGNSKQVFHYQLISLSLFQGEDSKGHYISLIREERCWSAYSDDKHIPVHLEDWRLLHTSFLSSSTKPFRPYLLFYQRLPVQKTVDEIRRMDGINPLATPIPSRSLSLSPYVKVNIPSFPTFSDGLKIEMPKTSLDFHQNIEEKMQITEGTRDSCICPICLRQFSRWSSFVRHRKIHSSVRPLKCSYFGCNQSFYRKDKLAEHEASHRPKRINLPMNRENQDGGLRCEKRLGGWENWEWEKCGGEGLREKAMEGWVRKRVEGEVKKGDCGEEG